MTTKKLAYLIHDFEEEFGTDPHHKVYRLEPGGPIDDEFVLVSTSSADASALSSSGIRASDGRSGYETRIFACDEEGNGADYCDWLHHYDGMDHEACLAKAGYEVVDEAVEAVEVMPRDPAMLRRP